MKSNRKFVIVIFCLLAVGSSVAWVTRQTAQPIATNHVANQPGNRHRPHVSGAHAIVAQLTEQLHLTKKQEADVTKLIDAAQPGMRAIQEDKRLGKDQKQAKIQQAMHDTAAKIGRLLTPEQNESFQKMIAEAHAH
jgi:Spy/CpxP family protein refolding chaperone